MSEFFKELECVTTPRALTRSGKVRFQGQSLLYCPITAVCMHKTGYYYSTWSVSHAADRLGLSEGIMERMVCAADNYGRHILSKTNKRYRFRMLKATELKEA